MRSFQTLAMWEKSVDKQWPGVLWQDPGHCPPRAVAFSYLSLFPYLQFSLLPSQHFLFLGDFAVLWPLGCWPCLWITKVGEGRGSCLTAVTCEGTPGVKGLKPSAARLRGSCHHSGVPYLLYRDSGQFIAISLLFAVFTLMEEKQVGEWWNCSLRRETDKVVNTCTKSHA